MLRSYYELTKPRVMLGNLLTTAAGFLLAANGVIDWGLFLATNIGTALVISSACVINNFLDQDIDARMERTKSRPLITGEIKARNALVFGVLLGLAGMSLLVVWTSLTVAAIGLFGFITYVWLYGALSKRKSVHGTLVGSISGGIPILAGYVAAAGGFDSGAWLVFAVLFLWQMPEFYSIAIYRRKEYRAAGVPVISVVRGVEHTKKMIFIYTVLFVAATLGLYAFGYADYTYLTIMSVLGLRWIMLGAEGLRTNKDDAWARRMFHFSLIVLLSFSFLIAVEAYLP